MSPVADAPQQMWLGASFGGRTGLDEVEAEQTSQALTSASIPSGQTAFGMNDNVRGILAMVGSSVAFVINDAATKVVTEELPTGQLIVMRGFMATIIIGTVAVAMGAMRPLSVLWEPTVALRVFLAGVATVFVILALKYLPLATVAAALQVSPLVVTACAAIFLGETVGWRRWLATAIGFAGVLLIIQPSNTGPGSYAWLALVAVSFVSMRELATRRIPSTVPTLFIAAASSAMITVVGLTFLPFETWIMPSGKALALLALASFCLLFAYTLVISAMRTGEVAVVIPFRYTLIPMAVTLGYLVWGDVPNTLATIGIAIVIGAGLYTLLRESASRRPASASGPNRSET